MQITEVASNMYFAFSPKMLWSIMVLNPCCAGRCG